MIFDLVLPVWEILGGLILATLAYAVVLNRLARFAQPIRLRMVELANQMKSDGQITRRDADQIEFYLNNSFSVWPAALMAVLLPILAVPAMLATMNQKPSPVGRGMSEMSNLFLLSVVAANPLFGALLLWELAIAFVVFALVMAQPLLVRQSFAWLSRAEFVAARSLRAA